MNSPATRIRHLRAFTVDAQGGADYHDQPEGHWIDDHIATPMAVYPEYRQSRRSFGLDVLGSLVVEAEAEGARACDLERIWDQMYRATLFYGRKGLVLNAISGVGLALWNLLGRLREQPVCDMLGGPVRDEQLFYATGARPDLAEGMGFVGGKVAMRHGPAEGEEGLRANVEVMRSMREKVGDDFFLACDCWMSMDVEYATRLGHRLDGLGVRWIEEALPPDDYWGYAELRRNLPPGMLTSTGEHEAGRLGFRLLLEMGCADIVQPDVGWCGGLKELLKIAVLADAHGRLVVPHGSSVYSYHFVITRHNSPFAEFLMMAPKADEVVPMFSPLLLDEPVPVDGRLKPPGTPGFGVRLNPECALRRPYTH